MYFYKYMLCDIFFHCFNKYIFRTPRFESCHADMCKEKWFINRIIFFAFSYCSIFFLFVLCTWGRCGRLVVGFTTTCAIKCLSPLKLSVRTSYMVYSIQHYMIKFVSDFRQVCDFLRVRRFPLLIKLISTI